MCSKATCRTCGKTTWSGCGQHVKQVMRGVPAEEQCVCTKSAQAPSPSSSSTTAPGGRFRALFRR